MPRHSGEASVRARSVRGIPRLPNDVATHKGTAARDEELDPGLGFSFLVSPQRHPGRTMLGNNLQEHLDLCTNLGAGGG